MSVLYEECLMALSDNVTAMGLNQSKIHADEFFEIFPLTSWGSVKWIEKEILFQSSDFQSFYSFLLDYDLLNEECFVLWGDPTLPIIITNLLLLVRNIDDVTAVSFDTFIFIKEKCIFIEIRHDGTITLGC